MKNALILILRYSSIPWIIRTFVQKNKTTILYYHDITPELFEKHILYLKKRYSIISLYDYVFDNYSPHLKRKLIITFDDGHKGNYDLLPALVKHNVPITIFLVSSIVNTNKQYWFKLPNLTGEIKKRLKSVSNEERVNILQNELNFELNKDLDSASSLDLKEINKMSVVTDFQSHTVTHPCLNKCSDQESEFEISQSKVQLESLLNKSIYALAFPNGDYTEREIQLAKKHNYKCVLNTNGKFNHKKFNNFNLNRISINDKSSIHSLAVRTSGVWNKIKHIL